VIREALRGTYEFLRSRKRAYQLVFGSPAGNAVLIDLASFCRANESCYADDPRKHAVAEGRREVWLRIQQHLHLSSKQLVALYAGKNILTEGETPDG
jgi:hypothetical protein